MRYQRLLFACFIALFISQISFSQSGPSSITWDEWGVPHIYGNTDEELMYAEGWAQMQLHANLITELYGRARGRAAEYWGKEKLPDDLMIHTLGFPELAEEWTAKQDPSYKKMITAFVKGLNDYVKAHPAAIKPENKVVLPLTEKDVNLHALFVIYGRFVGGNELGMTKDWKEMGSNTWAISPSHSASQSALLVQNPHLPWFGEFLFIEIHLMKPGHNMYGSTLVGFPGIAIAFNEHLGWSHTDNTIDNADTYSLQLKDGGYLLDGERKEFTQRKKIIHYKDDDGKMADKELTILTAAQGPVIKMGKGKALALRMPGYDRPNAGYQWWKMANADNFHEFESALQMAQIPFWNVMYADKAGNIFYLFNGLVPKRSQGNWGYWNRIIPGGKSADIWTEVLPYSNLPKVMNPSSGWLQNTNDPPWSCTFPNVLKPADFPAYMSPQYMDFRNQRSVHMLMENSSISFDQLVEDKLSTRLEMADRILDDLFKAIDQYGTDLSKEAKIILEKWDRKADSNSVGTLLFVRWANKMNPYKQSIYTIKWDPMNPLITPDGLADPKAAVAALDEVAAKIKTDFGSLSVPWGRVFRARSRTLNLPGNGTDGSVGSFRVAWPGDEENNIANIGGGDSWVGIIEFGEIVKARVLLSYGNSTQDNDPHNGDQLKLFSEKKLREAHFYSRDVEANKVRREVLKGGVFVEE